MSNTVVALQGFYEAAGGADWQQNSGWLGAPNHCDWKGVVCKRDLVSLHVGDRALKGTSTCGANL